MPHNIHSNKIGSFNLAKQLMSNRTVGSMGNSRGFTAADANAHQMQAKKFAHDKAMRGAGLEHLTFDDLPTIDVNAFLQCKDGPLSERAHRECLKVVQCLHKFGILMIRDPRVNEKDNDDYIDLMEHYFEQTGKRHYAGETISDFRPEHHWLVGATPEGIELARDNSAELRAAKLKPKDMPVSPMKPVYD